jgi:uncharacterized membrane protein YdjX (TVP38/TMEM64 family)
MGTRSLSRPTAALLVIILIAGVAALVLDLTGIKPSTGELVRAIRGAGHANPLAFGLLTIILASAFVPTPLLMASGGLVFGAWAGIPLTVASLSLAAALEMCLARVITRIEETVSERDRLLRYVTRVASGGWGSVVSLRLAAGVPFAGSNYALGLTPIRTRTLVAGSVVGLLPRTIIYGVLGSTLSSDHAPHRAIATAALVATGAFGLLLLLRRLRVPLEDGPCEESR